MNELISKAALEARRARYTAGRRVELVSMSDPYSKLTAGDQGTVDCVDDTGTVFVNWDCGSGLGAVYGVDEIRVLPETAISDTVLEQILAIRATGFTNMFDTKAVFELAVQRDYHELADFIFADTKAYSQFILSGEGL